MPLNKFNPLKLIYITAAKFCASVQIFCKLPTKKVDIRLFKDAIKEILSYQNSLFFNDTKCTKTMLNLANEVLTKRIKKNLETINFKSDNPKILILSHDFSLTGAPKAALMLTKTIKELYNISPIVLSLNKGEIAEEFSKENIPVLYYNELPPFKTDYLEFFNQFDLIIANSLMFDFLSKVKFIKTPVIWWSHEIFTTKRELRKIKEFMPHLFSFWGGSPLTRNILAKINDKKKNSLVLYGLPEISLPESTDKENNKIVFSLMGTWDERKRQDLLLKAIKHLSENIRKKTTFYIIGAQIDKKYSSKLVKEFEKYPEVTILPQQSFDELLNYYAKSDVILSTSDFDPMPIVVTYGLMFKKLCLCSDAIGTALLIKDQFDGLLFKAGKAKDLSHKIENIVENFSQYKTIAERGYDIYSKNFSVDLFKENLKKHIDEAISFHQEQKEIENKINNPFKVSIITASYNYAKFITKTINSVIEQTYENWELIIVDDGSKDNSLEIISQYLSNPKIKLYQHGNGTNKGLKDTILLGLSKAHGEYIAFLESDDYWDKDYLLEKVKLIDKNPEAKIISNDIELFGEESALVNKKCYTDYCKNLLLSKKLNLQKEMGKSNLCPTFSSTMIKRDILEKLDFNTSVPAWLDWWLWRQAIMFSRIYFVDKKLTHWQIHPQSYNQGIDFYESTKKIRAGLKPIISKLKTKK